MQSRSILERLVTANGWNYTDLEGALAIRKPVGGRDVIISMNGKTGRIEMVFPTLDMLDDMKQMMRGPIEELKAVARDHGLVAEFALSN